MQKIIEKLEMIIGNVQNRFQIPAIAVGLVGKNQIHYMRGFGRLSINKPQPIDEHTIFALASISKSTASASLAILVEEGRLKWSDPVKKYLPDFSLYDPFVDREIQVRDLLIHNSGLPPVSGGTIWYDSKFSRKEVVHRLRYLKPVSSFRSGYAYQNVCYLVAGEIIEAITGISWDEFIAERIFNPLGMNRTTTKLDELTKLKNFASPHKCFNGKVKEIPFRNHENIGAGAAVNSSIYDWSRYVQMLLNNGSFHGNTVLSPQRINELWAAQTCIPIEIGPQELQKTTQKFSSYGMGWFLRDYAGQKIVSHSGGLDGMRTQMCILPEINIGFLVFTNLEPGFGLNALFYSFLDLLTGKELSDWVSTFEKSKQESFIKQSNSLAERNRDRALNTKPSSPLDKFCGEYFDPKVGAITVSQTQNKLRLDFEESNCFHAELTHWHLDTFEILWDDPYIPNGLLTFILDKNGMPEQIVLKQPNLLDVDFSELEIYWIGENDRNNRSSNG
ncbi:MAG TPA: serine hydrolase [Anaerolineaceae bacterium]|nr:serine hydrolase [Anaerolineaceae bacterium]